jgi:hypothetical protein
MCRTAHATMNQSYPPTSESSGVCGAIEQSNKLTTIIGEFINEQEFVGALASW